jgi:hypothetical protein
MGRVDVETVDAYECPVCGEFHPDYREALNCCGCVECEECGEVYDNEDEAKRCCWNKNMICPVCGGLYESIDETKECCAHKKDEDGDPLPDYPCQFCGKKFPEVCECQNTFEFK